MKLVALWIAVLAFAALAAGSCSVSHRSGDFACQTTADCSDGRICSDGLCVGGSATIDAGTNKDGGQANSCPTACTSCDLTSKSCKIDCSSSNGGCNFPVTCPTGWSCEIDCTADGSCRSGVTCSDKACRVECIGTNSCRNVACGSGACTVDCAGDNTCHAIRGNSGSSTINCAASGTCSDVTCGAGKCDVECNATATCNTVTCGASCACDVGCNVPGACNMITCSNTTCETSDPPSLDGCSSSIPSCNTCRATNAD